MPILILKRKQHLSFCLFKLFVTALSSRINAQIAPHHVVFNLQKKEEISFHIIILTHKQQVQILIESALTNTAIKLT
jgi:hypothetical protein